MIFFSAQRTQRGLAPLCHAPFAQKPLYVVKAPISCPKIWNFRIFSLYLHSKYYLFMETTALNPTQMHLLKLFAFNNSEEYAREVQKVLTRHFQSRLDAEADRLWDEGILDQDKLDEIRKMDLHSK